jgi:LysM repeat protein
MTERGAPTADSSACPFVAFEDDRDERADRPDHRHRCFAEAVPAPRALAHQEAYCLSSAFPVCPTFQDWARREAAHAQPGQARPAESDDADEAVGAAVGADDEDDADDLWSAAREVPLEERPRRNPPRDWAAPPPWASGTGGAGGAAAMGSSGSGHSARQRRDDDDPADESRGLAGSAADRVARGANPDQVWMGAAGAGGAAAAAGAAGAASAASSSRSSGREAGAQEPPSGPSAPPDPELAGLVGRRRSARGGQEPAADDVDAAPVRPVRRPTVSSTRDRSRDHERERERERAAEERQHDGPSWERQRRYEAYPSIRTRASLAGVPRLPRGAVLVGALVVAALLLFLLPTILNFGGRVTPAGASAAPTAAPSESVEPTPTPVPTPQTYTIKSGDALARIARRFGLTLDQLLAANKQIKDPNRIKVGDQIVIPTPPPPDEVPASEAPSASPS